LLVIENHHHANKYSKYKFMEGQMQRTKQNTKLKMPEIERTLELVKFLKEKQVSRVFEGQLMLVVVVVVVKELPRPPLTAVGAISVGHLSFTRS